MVNLQENIRRLRQWKNLKQGHFAECLGISQGKLSKLESGGDLKWSLVLKIASELGVSVQDLIGLDTNAVFQQINQTGNKNHGVIVNNLKEIELESFSIIKAENIYLKTLLEKSRNNSSGKKKKVLTNKKK